MMNLKRIMIATALPATILLFAFVTFPSHISIYMAGDSTMAIKDTRLYPETGWGMPFRYMFDTTVIVNDLAKNGASTRSFFTDGLWQKIVDGLKPGDYVLIQFGHNDEIPTKTTATTPDEFKKYLNKYINETRSRQGIPILITPVARRKFDSVGIIQGTHEVYSSIVREVAKTQNTLLIDLDKESQGLLQQMGSENSKLLYNHLLPGEHPNYPNGKEDDTHFNELGARKMAEIVLKDIRLLDTRLSAHIVNY